MSLTIPIDNSRDPLGEILQAELRGADEFMAASAFLNSRGLGLIESEMRRILESGGRVSIVHGADFRIADPDAVQTLVDMKTRYPQMSYRVHCDWSLTRSQSFHPKLYIARKDRRRYCAAIGSSNLTLGGLLHNTEVNVVIRGEISDVTIQNCLKIYEEIHNSPNLREPNTAFPDKYAVLYGRAENLPLSDDPPSDIKNLFDSLTASAPSVSPEKRRAPETQLDYVAAALARLGGEERRDVALSKIIDDAERLSRAAGESYKWGTFDNSARRAINNNKDGEGREIFESGKERAQYRLSENGLAYARELDR